MPGLVGVISKQQPEQCALDVKCMLASMQHELFYTSGMYSNPGMSVYIGWLAHPNSFCDCLPITNHAKDRVLFFTGEVFADQPKSALRGDKEELYDAGNLMRLYEEDEEKFFEKLNGWFCGLLLDLRLGKAFLFNDRYGMNRVFVHEGKKGFYFASEAKALLSVLPETRHFDLNGIGEFLTCGCTLGNRSLFKGVHILPNGALWTFDHGEIKRRGSFFDLSQWEGQDPLHEEVCSQSIVDLFGSIAKRYSRGIFPIGLSLTGGLDSRMVIAAIEMEPGDLSCYTFGSMYRDTFDVKISRKVAKACDQQHQTLVLGEEFLREFPHYLEKAVYISDGYLGLSGAAELYVSSIARSISPVRLTGDLGGELLRCVRGMKFTLPKIGLINPELFPFLIQAKTVFQDIEATAPLTFALFYQAQSLGYGPLTTMRSQLVHRTPFFDNDLLRLSYQAPTHLLRNSKLSLSIIARYKPYLLEIPTDRGLLGNSSRVEYHFRRCHREALFKAEYWTGHGMFPLLAAISRFGLNGMLERSFIGQHKFQHFRKWTQERIADFITDVLHTGARDLKEFFNLSQMEKMVHNHLSGKQNYTKEIDKFLTVALTYRSLIKGGAVKHHES